MANIPKHTFIAFLILLLAFRARPAEKPSLQLGTSKPARVKAGAVSGRVFLITEGGDLKPARLANVYLFYGGVEGTKEREGDAPARSALEAWHAGLLKEAESLTAELGKPEALQWSESLSCLKDLHTYAKALVATLQWSQDNKKTDQVLSTEADEEGNFKISLTPGFYILAVKGHAGFNDAFWSKSILVKSGAEIALKLSAPEKACIVLE